MAARKISSKSLDFGTPEKAFEGTLRQEITIIQGIAPEKAKDIVKRIKDGGFKVQASIQKEQVRVTSKSKDELQSVMQALRAVPPDIALQFTNFR